MAPTPSPVIAEVVIFTHLDGFEGTVAFFKSDVCLRDQVSDLCWRNGWIRNDEGAPKRGTGPSEFVLLHGATDFILAEDELQRLPKRVEVRLDDVSEVFERVVRGAAAHGPESVRAIEAFVHNARPDSWFLRTGVERDLMGILFQRPLPKSALEWEALLVAFCTLLEADAVQDAITAQLKGKKTCKLLELAILALQNATTRLAFSYACTLLRHILLAGNEGLGAIYRVEAQLRREGHDVSVSDSLLQAAIEGDTSALQVINDVLMQCTDDEILQQFKQELRTEAAAVGASDLFGSLLQLDNLTPEQRLNVSLRLSVVCEARSKSSFAGIQAGQAVRELAQQKEISDLRRRLDIEHERLREAQVEQRRVALALREVAPFFMITPASLRKNIRRVLANGWDGQVWPQGYSPLHVVSELGDTKAVPLLINLKANPLTKDAKGRTAVDIAVAKGHHAMAEALTKVGSGRYDEEDDTAMDQFVDDLTAAPSFCGTLKHCCIYGRWRCKQIRRALHLNRFRRRRPDRDEEPSNDVELSLLPSGFSSRRSTVGRVESDDGEEQGLAALDSDKVEAFSKMLVLGEEQVRKKLKSEPILGGLALRDDEVDQAIALIKEKSKRKAETILPSSDTEPAENMPYSKGSGKAAPERPGGKGEKGAKGGGCKGGGGGVEPSKPEFVPPHRMKPLWWNRILVDPNSAANKTVWAQVPDFLERLHATSFSTRFLLAPAAAQPDAKKAADIPVKAPTVLRILKDPNEILAREVALRMLPRPREIGRAIAHMDEVVLTRDLVEVLLEHAFARDNQMTEMRAALEHSPDLPWALAESYMWEVGQDRFAKPRLQCLSFIQSCGEVLSDVLAELKVIARVCQELRASTALRHYLACILACGNYLNGGTSRGRADGFEVEQLGKLMMVKDNEGKDLRYFIGAELCPGGVFHDVGEALFPDLINLTSSVRRQTLPNSDGGVCVVRKLGGAIEDYELLVRSTLQSFDEKAELLQACLQCDELDTTDPLRMEMPRRFKLERDEIDKVVLALESTKAEYKKVQWYFASTLKYDEIVLLWDEAFFPKDVLELKERAKNVTPSLCLHQPSTYADFVRVWDFSEHSKASARGPSNNETIQDASSKPGNRAGALVRTREAALPIPDAPQELGSSLPLSASAATCRTGTVRKVQIQSNAEEVLIPGKEDEDVSQLRRRNSANSQECQDAARQRFSRILRESIIARSSMHGSA